jgi:diguanylate cyclase (GGDEF)-like protein/PAS domain S-box-containing protein
MPQQRNAQLPQDHRFYERVLDHLPSPVLVLRSDGTVVYGNQALLDMSGWTLEDGLGIQMLDVVHPDDQPWVIEAFGSVVNAGPTEQAIGSSWSPVRFRIIARDGSVIPIEATGAGGLQDDVVDGIIYNIRNCRDDELLADVFAGVASHDPISTATPAIAERLGLPPHRMAVAVFEQRANGGARCIVATHPTLSVLPATSSAAVPWVGLATEAARIDVNALPVEVRDHLRRAGFRSCFHAGAHAPDFDTTLRLVACSSSEHTSDQGPMGQIDQARELLALIVAKSHNDRMIANNAMRDDLTGLPNRLGLAHRFERLAATSDDCAVMFVDIDNFKPINDRFGHAAGDRVLSAVADRLVRTVRPDDFVCRIGGDEFAIVLADSAGRLNHPIVRDLADRVVAILSQPVTHNGEDIPLAASVGVALDHDRDLDELLHRADGAMYRAKRAGGARHHLDTDARSRQSC